MGVEDIFNQVLFEKQSTQTRNNFDLNIPLLIFAAVLLFQMLLGFARIEPKQKLENDPQCGLTTGGKDECFWDCPLQIFSNLSYYEITTEPACLRDCFPKNHCVQHFLDDYERAGGICKGSFGDVFYNGVYPTSNTVACGIDPASGLIIPGTGICSPATQAAIINDPTCVADVFSQPFIIYSTMNLLVVSLCDATVVNVIQDVIPNLSPRFAPILNALEYKGVIVNTKLEYENTRHRYPWICSLRGKYNARKEHLCGTTLLSRPPGPVVMVTSAHCTYLCKSGDDVVPNCCCRNVGNFTCPSTTNCGDAPEVVEMTGVDVEVICGEWETGNNPASFSQEQYNVILPILEIVRHPKFNISQNTNYVSNDIAVLKLDSRYTENDFSKINPACLPDGESSGSTSGIHSGWSTPPDLSYVIQFAAGYLPIYRDFFKQYHYSMDLVSCKDPVTNILGDQLLHPSNSYYPPGTVCAKDVSLQFCPTTGESGSSLMVQDSSSSRFHAQGVLSFIKGCTRFEFGETRTVVVLTESQAPRWQLVQIATNPAVYTKISCYLPWIADQYGLELSQDIEQDDDCVSGTGDTDDDNVDECFNIPSYILIRFPIIQEDVQTKCIFPFYLNDKKYTSCIFLDQNSIITPVFRCPIRSVANQKIGDIFSYTREDLYFGSLWADGFCPTNSHADPTQAGPPVIGANGLEEVDPANTNCLPSQLRPVFSTCSNNCPGVNFPVVGGGTALLFTSALAGSTLFSPALAVPLGLGILGLGLGGNMLASTMCIGPVYCRAASGQCCLLIINRARFVCPARC